MGHRRVIDMKSNTASTDARLRTVKDLMGAYPFGAAEVLPLVHLGHQSANQLGHNYFGSEHYLLGLTHPSAAKRVPRLAKVTTALAIEPALLRGRITEIIGPGSAGPIDEAHMLVTHDSVRCADSMLRESVSGEITLSDMIVSLLIDKNSVAAQVLAMQGVTSAVEARNKLRNT